MQHELNSSMISSEEEEEYPTMELSIDEQESHHGSIDRRASVDDISSEESDIETNSDILNEVRRDLGLQLMEVTKENVNFVRRKQQFELTVKIKDNQIQQLEAEKKIHREQKEEMIKDSEKQVKIMESYRSKLAEKENRIKELESQLLGDAANLNGLRKDVSDRDTAIIQLRSKLKICKDENNQSSKSLQDKVNDYSALNEKHETLKTEVEELKKAQQKAKLVQQSKEAASKPAIFPVNSLGSALPKGGDWLKQIQKYKSELAESRKETESEKAKVDSEKAKVEKFKKRIDSLKNEKNDLETQRDKYKEKFNKALKRAKSAEKSLEECQRTKDVLNSSLEECQSEKEKINSDNENLKIEIGYLLNKHTKYLSETDRDKSEIDKLNLIFDAFKAENNKIKDENNLLELLQKWHDINNQFLKEVKSQYSELKGENNILKEQVLELRGAIVAFFGLATEKMCAVDKLTRMLEAQHINMACSVKTAADKFLKLQCKQEEGDWQKLAEIAEIGTCTSPVVEEFDVDALVRENYVMKQEMSYYRRETSSKQILADDLRKLYEKEKSNFLEMELKLKQSENIRKECSVCSKKTKKMFYYCQ